MQSLKILEQSFMAIMVLTLMGCNASTNPIRPPLVTGLVFTKGEMLDSRNFIARIQYTIENATSRDLCLVSPHFAVYTVPSSRLPQYADATVEFADVNPEETYDVLYIRSGDTVALEGQVDARDFIIHLVKNDPNNQYNYDLADEYSVVGVATVYDCIGMPNSERITTSQLRDSHDEYYLNVKYGFLGFVNFPRTEPFHFR